MSQLWKFLCLLLPYVKHWVALGEVPMTGFSRFSPRQTEWQVIQAIVQRCWAESIQPRKYRLTRQLTVLNGAPQAPCHDCASNCCTNPDNNSFSTVVIYPPEVNNIRRVAPHVPLVPSVRDIGFFHIEIGIGRCPLLADNNRCTIYHDRPFACRFFVCANGLFNADERYHEAPAQFLRQNPKVKTLLLEHGYREVNTEDELNTTRRKRDKADPVSKEEVCAA